MIKKIKTYVITGFLGSGKTTLLQKLLGNFKSENILPAIVLNEIGDQNVEEDLFKGEHLLEMLNGCICCSIQGDFTKELDRFLLDLQDEEVPDVLLIEGTGIANPLEIVDGLTDPLLIDKIDLHSIINVVDASKYLEYQSIFSSSKEVRTVLKAQVQTSSVIIVNKLDLTNEKEKQKVLSKITSLKKEEAPLIEASFGQVDLEPILKRRFQVDRLTTIEEPSKCGCSKSEKCEEHTENHSFQAIKIDASSLTIDRIQLEKWFSKLPITMIRAKGIVQLKETVGYFQFQYASKQFSFSRLKEAPKVDPCVILIGSLLNKDEINDSFRETFKKEES